MNLTIEQAKRLQELDQLMEDTWASPEEFEEYRFLVRKKHEATNETV